MSQFVPTELTTKGSQKLEEEINGQKTEGEELCMEELLRRRDNECNREGCKGDCSKV